MADTNINEFKTFFLKLLETDEKEIKLDTMQQTALFIDKNAVIAAGAGSGKTQVLATRFAWLILTGTKIDKILTLTFTKKAAAEMYQRIYKTLDMFAENKELGEKFPSKKILAQEALYNFSTANIQTLDSYCGKIVRQYANKYGIRPDFQTGSADTSADIKTKAFNFILQHKTETGIQTFAQPGKLQDFAENTFGAAIEKYTSLATKDGYFSKKLEVQLNEIVNVWNRYIPDNSMEYVDKEYNNINAIFDDIKKSNILTKEKDARTSKIKTLEKKAIEKGLTDKEIENFQKNRRNLQYINDVSSLFEILENNIKDFKHIDKNDIKNVDKELMNNIVLLKKFLAQANKISKQYSQSGYIKTIRIYISNINKCKDLYGALFAFIENYGALTSLDSLFDDFLKEINSSKRATGNLSFNDITEMAIKILSENEDARNQEKRAFEKIMIDEFQDNNGKNRDLLYMLSLKDCSFEKDKDGKEIDTAEDALPLIDQIRNERDENKLFFVGDEKQSIYKFRGADVSVFNALTKNDENYSVPMTYNYRSTPELINAFNIFFTDGNGIFDECVNEEDKKDFEAYYDNEAKAKGDKKTELTASNVPIHINLLKKFNKYDEEIKKLYVSEAEQLAYNIAKKIKEMDNGKQKWTDFAILERSRTDSGILTKYLNLFNIPYSIDQFYNIFEEGIINDFYNFFRLCVYPSDIHSYAAYLTSPLCGLSENAVEVILSYLVSIAKKTDKAIADIDIKSFELHKKDLFDKLNKLIDSTKDISNNKSKINETKEILKTSLEYFDYFILAIDNIQDESLKESVISTLQKFKTQKLFEDLNNYYKNNSKETLKNILKNFDFDNLSTELDILEKQIDNNSLASTIKDELNSLNKNNYNKFVAAMDFIKHNKNKVLQQRITSTLSYLWNNKGYKYETYLSEKSQLISEHFDMFFELGRKTDEAGKNISWFVDQLAITQSKYSQEDADIDIREVSYPFERNNAVQIMTIHKSKGLEFPHVFIYGCVDVPSRSDKEKIFFDEKTGISIKPDNGEKNYFSLIVEEKAKIEEAAELKRLIYVAITRAKESVYIYGKWTPPAKKKNYTEINDTYKPDSLQRLIERIIVKYYYKKDEKPIELEKNSNGPFFTPGTAFDYTIIEPIEYKNLKNPYENDDEKTVDEQREYALNKTAEIYDEKNADLIYFESIPPYDHKTPSSLEPSLDLREKSETKEKEENELNKKIATLVPLKLPYNDFGTLAHAYEEAQVNGISLEEFQPDYQLIKKLNQEELTTLKEICIKMCHNFKESSLGQDLEKAKENAKNKVQNACYRAEWSFKLLYTTPTEEESEKNDIFTGSMDLIFGTGNGNYTIVDYKSDKNIEPETYIGQQRCYRTAAAKLLGVDEKSISLYLYYLRYNKTIKLD